MLYIAAQVHLKPSALGQSPPNRPTDDRYITETRLSVSVLRYPNTHSLLCPTGGYLAKCAVTRVLGSRQPPTPKSAAFESWLLHLPLPPMAVSRLDAQLGILVSFPPPDALLSAVVRIAVVMLSSSTQLAATAFAWSAVV